jgi:type IV secretion system protein VirD4
MRSLLQRRSAGPMPPARGRGAGAGGKATPLEIGGTGLLVAVAVWRLADGLWQRVAAWVSQPWARLGAAGLGVLVLAVAISSAHFLLRRRRPGAGRKQRSSTTNGTWAGASDLRPLRVPRPVAGRLVLGRCGRHLLAVEHHQSVIVIGPTQSHKTSGVAVPAILEWAGPVVATSVKTDLVRDTVAWRRQVGQVLVYDPAAATGLAGARWSPLTASGSWQGARRVAAALCSVARSSGRGGMEDAGFWYAMAEKLLAPLLFAAATAGASMADVCRWVDIGEMREVQLALELAGVPEALRAAEASFGREERQRSSVYATLESVLEAFSDPSALASAEIFDGGDAPVVRPADLLDGGSHTLYVCAPAHEQERLQPVFVAVLRQVIEAAIDRAAVTGRPLDPPLLVVLDEAANVAPVADLDRLASTAAGHGIQLVTVFQDMAQIEARYGPRAGTVVNNHRAKLLLSGISDPATLEHVSRLAGEEELFTPATTVDADGRVSRTHSATTRALAPAAWLRRIAPGNGVLVYGHLPPAQVSLRPWFADATLRERAGTTSSAR